MSRIINNEGFKPGSIYRIALENFVTYKEVEFYPGKSLNLIIGPNGTGKSTFVCALILGLCGKPSAIGRSKTIAEFVRHDCQSATIEIELYNNVNQRNIIIKRTITIKNSSTWSIDYKTVSEKKVKEKISAFNIQVDNLCQLLPQDKVHNFSELNPFDLLHSTLTSVGRFASIEDWEKLIKLKNDQTKLVSNLKNDEKRLQDERRQNQGLKEVIDAMNERNAIEVEIEMCEKKLLWANYKELSDKVKDIKRERDEADTFFKEREKEIEPLRNEMEGIKRGITLLEEKKINTNRKIQDKKENLKSTILVIELKEEKLKEINMTFEQKLNEHKNRERELIDAKVKEEKLLSDKRALERDGGDENSLKMEIEKLKEQREIKGALMETYRRNKAAQLYPLDNNIRSWRYKIKKFEDVQRRRLDKLASRHTDTYKAWEWLENNMDQFKNPVYGPMMLNINFTEPKFARYLECTVPLRDLKAFTFESKEDMNKFTKIVREQLKLKQVNAVHSEGGEFNVRSKDIRNLSYLGFYTCLLDTITAPNAILRYLCNVYHIQNIPIGNKHTFDNVERVPENITFYFTENHRIATRFSYYKVRSTTTIEIRDPDILADSVDEDIISSLKSQLLEFEQRKQILESEFDAHLTLVGDEWQQIERKMREKSELLHKVKTTKMHLHIQRRKVQDLESDPGIDIQAENIKCIAEKKECVIKQCKAQRDMSNYMNVIQQLIMEMEKQKIELSVRRSAIVQKDSQYRRMKSELDAAKKALDNVDNNLEKTLAKAKRMLNEAKMACGNQIVGKPDFPYTEQFSKLPADKELLEDYRNERVAKVSLMDNFDEKTLKDYETREREIGNLERLIGASSKSKLVIKNEIDEIKSRWLPPLESLAREINENFSSMFQKLGLVGEVILYKGANDEDFSKYGLHIMVQFRAGEKIRQLTRDTQSGGERALSTALYLLAIQARVAVPFRCVDEINQGMDAKNERDMLQLLIQATTESDSQYFLLTPKLLLDLEFNEKTTIHTVMNGANIMNYKQWKIRDFIKAVDG